MHSGIFFSFSVFWFLSVGINLILMVTNCCQGRLLMMTRIEGRLEEVRNRYRLFSCDTLQQHRVSHAMHMYVYECINANIYTDARFCSFSS